MICDSAGSTSASVASRQAVTIVVTNITNWVGHGTIRGPAGIAAAALRVAVPEQAIALNHD